MAAIRSDRSFISTYDTASAARPSSSPKQSRDRQGANYATLQPSHNSEHELHCQLKLPRLPSGVEHSEPAAIRCQSQRGREVRVVQQIESLRAELHVAAFMTLKFLCTPKSVS